MQAVNKFSPVNIYLSDIKFKQTNQSFSALKITQSINSMVHLWYKWQRYKHFFLCKQENLLSFDKVRNTVANLKKMPPFMRQKKQWKRPAIYNQWLRFSSPFSSNLKYVNRKKWSHFSWRFSQQFFCQARKFILVSNKTFKKNGENSKYTWEKQKGRVLSGTTSAFWECKYCCFCSQIYFS